PQPGRRRSPQPGRSAARCTKALNAAVANFPSWGVAWYGATANRAPQHPHPVPRSLAPARVRAVTAKAQAVGPLAATTLED
ncbi:hypothetical protein, partial [Streptomyces sp. NPDC000188]|uniref:hypothetical protein n=1 Tax=Streptomyces sp. NPDC000188 TaxID=3154245 RepID=UPI00332099C0